jgi:signal transduction histidine kinase
LPYTLQVLLPSRYEQLLRYLALFGWVLAGIPTLARLLTTPSVSLVVWLLAFIAFAIAFWQNTGTLRGEEFGTLASIRRLLLQSVTGVVTIVEGEYGFSALFAVIVSMQLNKTFAAPDARRFVPRFMLAPNLETQHLPQQAQDLLIGLQANDLPHVSMRGSVIWVVVQTLGVVLVYGLKVGILATLPLLVAFFGFQMVILISNHLAISEKRSRRALELANAELRATQTLLANTSRVHERLRISRDLHDILGHHLTVLALNLEIAQHAPTADIPVYLKKAHTLSKLLLSDVRHTVSDLREREQQHKHLELADVLRELVTQVPTPKIHLALPKDLHVEDGNLAQLLLCATQEIISNTVCHAEAENLFLKLEQQQQSLSLNAFDDGKGMEIDELESHIGNGLRGLSERLGEVGGHVKISSELGVGTRLQLHIPLHTALNTPTSMPVVTEP